MASNVANMSSDVPRSSAQEKIGLPVNTSSTSLDKAAVYLHIHRQLPHEEFVNERTLVRKIDWRIIPLAFAYYTVVFIDKVNISVCVLAQVLMVSY